MLSTSPLLGKVLLLGAIAALPGCASVQAPGGYLPGADGAQSDVYGGWITVKYREGDSIYTAGGEFISFRDSVIYVLTESEPVSIRYEKVISASLDVNTRLSDVFAAWTILGTLSTSSHGYYMFLTVPLWLSAGIPSAITASRDGLYADYPSSIAWWQGISRFSRFPQGIPKEVNLQSLKLKKFPHE